MINQICQPDALIIQELRGYHGVKQVIALVTKVAFEQPDIVISAVKYFLNLRISEQPGKQVEVVEPQRVEDIIRARVGYLDYADLFPERMQAVTFGVHTQLSATVQMFYSIKKVIA
jgi:hypothetical protein